MCWILTTYLRSFYIYVSTPVLSIYEQMTYPSPSLSASVSLSSKYMNPWAIMLSMSHLVFMCSPMHADAVHTCSVIVQQIKPYAFSLIRTVQSTGKVLHIAVRTRVWRRPHAYTTQRPPFPNLVSSGSPFSCCTSTTTQHWQNKG